VEVVADTFLCQMLLIENMNQVVIELGIEFVNIEAITKAQMLKDLGCEHSSSRADLQDGNWMIGAMM